MNQFRLPGLDPPRQVRPDAHRPDPLFWMRRLCVLKELEPGPEHVIRSIELRRGLNILWAPPKKMKGENELFKSGVAGHTAGKTTFCRLVRYVLGERAFAPESIRKRVREKYPFGWVLAEVFVGGHLWTVARPFGIGPHSFCLYNSGIDSVFDGSNRSEYQTFIDELEKTVVAGLPAGRFPTTDDLMRWEHLLPWITRDQECRFGDVLEWRHSGSASESPALSIEERQFLVRSVMGLISDVERQEQSKNIRLLSQKRAATDNEPLLSHQAAVEHARVKILLNVELPAPETGLFGSGARTELEGRINDLEKSFNALESSDTRAAMQASLERAIMRETNARRDLEDVEARLAAEKGALEQLMAGAAGEAQVALLNALPPARDYCNVPMRLAREHGCPLATSRPVDLGERINALTAAEELAEFRAVVDALGKGTAERRRLLMVAEANSTEARRAFLSAATAYNEKQGRLLEERARIEQIRQLVSDAEEAAKKSAEQAQVVKSLAFEIEASHRRQEELRRERREGFARFSASFDYVVRALLGDEVEGRIDASGRGLSLIVEHHGERESAALATVKLLAFDLAAMTESIQGRGYFPRFLIHDGPREADMAPDIYERLFLYGVRLEECFKGEPGFQYIITTTAAPPSPLQSSPWLLQPRLDATTPAGRLLRIDL